MDCTVTHKNAQEFLRRLGDGSKAPCDKTSPHFREKFEFPPYYDEDKIKRAQKFCHEHTTALYFNMILTVVLGLAIDGIRKILIFTNRSNEPKTAYRRYVLTFMHINSWFTNDFKPGKKSLDSLKKVKAFHNAASTEYRKYYGDGITQKLMALAQLEFVGLVVIRPKMIGLYNVDKEDIEAYIHFWRVIGYLLGMEEQYNICRESLEETKIICNLLIQNEFKVYVEKMDKEFLNMTKILSDGLMSFALIDNDCFLLYGLVVMNSFEDNYKQFEIFEKKFDVYKQLTMMQRIIYTVMKLAILHSVATSVLSRFPHIKIWL